MCIIYKYYYFFTKLIVSYIELYQIKHTLKVSEINRDSFIFV